MPTTPLPTQMSGVVIESTGGVEVLGYRTDLPLPEPKDDEVLIKNNYAAVNFIDTLVVVPILGSGFPSHF
jgi:NADPH2:quinone reductase